MFDWQYCRECFQDIEGYWPSGDWEWIDGEQFDQLKKKATQTTQDGSSCTFQRFCASPPRRGLFIFQRGGTTWTLQTKPSDDGGWLRWNPA